MSRGEASFVSVVDYGMGNLFSVQKACEHVGLRAVITRERSKILDAQGLILPGVGAFGDAMRHLEEMDLIGPIKDFIAGGRPFFGICLGMQLLMTQSEEFGIHKGLDIIRGLVVRFPNTENESRKTKVPQVGWNQIFPPDHGIKRTWPDSPLKTLEQGVSMYFVHSYYPVPADKSIILSVSTYENVEYCSSILWKNVFAAQFHPEKSAAAGIQIYQNWAGNILEPCQKPR